MHGELSLVIVLLCFIVPAAVAGWAWYDAVMRERSGLAAALLVLLLFPIGIIIWILIRPPHPPPFGQRSFDPRRFRSQ